MKPMIRRLSASMAIAVTCALAGVPASAQLPAPQRTIVFISDTHMGIGKKADGSWQATEDFRWGKALDGFLSHLEKTYSMPVDVVILGDVLELWQPFPNMPCRTPKSETSCTIAETAALAEYVAKAHDADLKRLGTFSQRGDNRVYLVSGNHDAALNEDTVWAKVVPHFGTGARVELVKSGIWTSPLGLTVAEHGQQIGRDVNKFDRWPKVNDPTYPDHMARPWGQLFVQKIFNEVEEEYPIIDNISPESVGAKYRIADKGVAATAADLAKFVLFNLFETSRSQKAKFLSMEEDKPLEWDVELGRAAGYRLVIASLPPDDDFSRLIKDDSDLGKALRNDLDVQVKALPNAGIRQLCDQAAMRGGAPCTPSLASNMVESVLRSEKAIITPHLAIRRDTHRSMINFVYGHTHKYQLPWPASVDGSTVSVANTGAFQRVIDEAGFERRRIDKKVSRSETLRRIKLDDLPACYTFVVVKDERKAMELWRWHQPEDAAQGSVELWSSPRCQ